MASDNEEIKNDQITEQVSIVYNESTSCNDSDSAPEEMNFSSTRKTAQQLVQSQMNVLNRIKKQEQEKRKLKQDRNIEQKKSKIAKKFNQLTNEESNSFEDDKDVIISNIERETQNSRLRIVLNDDDQIDKINNRFIKKYKEINNRMISFKDRSIQTNPSIKRVKNYDAGRLLHKRKVK